MKNKSFKKHFSKWNLNLKKSIPFLFAMLFIISSSKTNAQAVENCAHDYQMTMAYSNYPGYEQVFEDNNTIIEETIINNEQALIDDDTEYVLPVVVHVMHLGDNTPSYISDAQIQLGIDQLNADFANMTNGSNLNIQFCLAQRKPDGTATNGINRIDASNISNYASIGLAPYYNEFDVKAESVWPNNDYINIWIVHDIANDPPGGTYFGYATFPGSGASIDGLVVQYDAFGTSTNSKVVTHEMGHFFQLYHTFESEVSGSCSPNAPCDSDLSNDNSEVCCRNTGDRCCDTPSHEETFGCPTTGNNSCTNLPWDDVINNHMSYTNNDCRTSFTEDQMVRVRCALKELRNGLTFSLGCEEPCSNVNSNFTITNPFGYFLVAEDQSNLTYDYYVNGKYIESNNQSDIYYDEFISVNIEFCLVASDGICSTRTCKQYLNFEGLNNCPPTDVCELIYNSGFSINNIIEENFHMEIEGEPNNSFLYDKVCSWVNYQSSPFFCQNDYNDNYFGMFLPDEKIANFTELSLVSGAEYNISFEYYVNSLSSTSEKIDEIYLGLVDSPAFLINSDITKIVSIKDLGVNNTNAIVSNTPCLLENAEFKLVNDMSFVYSNSMGKYLIIGGENQGLAKYLLIKNISISLCSGPCSPDIDISYEKEGCSYTFAALDQGEADSYEWNITDSQGNAVIDSDTHYGETFNYFLSEPGNYSVCVTSSCSDNQSATTCLNLTVLVDCMEECFDFIISIDTKNCGELNEPKVGNYTIEVPKSVFLCPGGISSDSGDPDASILSVEIIESNTEFNIVNLSVLFTSPNARGILVLCTSDGSMQCFPFALGEEEQCEFCPDVPIASTAICDDSNPFDETATYIGSFTISNLTLFNDVCGSTSTHAGYVDKGFSNLGGGSYSFDYEINTSSFEATSFEVLVCVILGIPEVCYTINISIDDPCPEPVDCVLELYSPVETTCSSVEDGEATFNITGTIAALQEIQDGYTICSDIGTINGGTILNDNSTIDIAPQNDLPWYLNFDLDISIPCVNLLGNLYEYEITLFLCGPNDEKVCITIPIIVECDECDDYKKRTSINVNDTDLTFEVFPNPSSNLLQIQCNNCDKIESKTIQLYDSMGKLIFTSSDFDNQDYSLDATQFMSGIYFLSISNENKFLHQQKIVILK